MVFRTECPPFTFSAALSAAVRDRACRGRRFSLCSCLTAVPKADFLPGASMGTPGFRTKDLPETGRIGIVCRPIGGSDRFIIHEFPPRCNRLHHIFRIALPAARTPGRAKTPTGQKSRGIPSLHHWGRGTAPAVEGVRLLLLAKRKRRVAVKNRTEGIKISYCDRDCLTYVLRIKCIDYLCI